MRLAKLKHAIADIIEPKKKPSVVSIIYNVILSLVIITSCVFVFVDIFAPEGASIHEMAHIVEYIAVGMFLLEYVLKLFVSEVLYEGEGWFKSKLSYITSFDSFIDIVCLLSIFLNQVPKEFASIRLLKLVKLMRLAKLKNAVEEINQKDEKKDDSKMHNFKYRIFQIIYRDEQGDKLSKAYDIVSIIIILLSVAIIILDTFEFPQEIETTIYICEIVFTVFFIIDYIMRVWTAEFEYPEVDKDHAKTKYIFSFLAIIDLLSILPVLFTLMPDTAQKFPQAFAVLKILKLFRIARLLKMSRYMNGLKSFGEAVKEKKKQIFFSIIILLFLVLLSSVLLYSFEDAAGNTQFQNGFSGITYAITILTGFGDTGMEVISVGGKIMVVIMMIAGACVVGVPIGIITGEFTNMVAKAANQEEQKPSDLFIEFSKRLTDEEKLKIIADNKELLEKKEEEEK